MSDESKPSRYLKAKSRTDRSKIWVGLSMMVSTLILIWSFSLPFQSSDQSSVDQGELPLDPGEVLRKRQVEARAFREAARALDQEFMQQVASVTTVSTQGNVPGLFESRQKWKADAKVIQRQIAELSRAEEGSLEWQYRQELIESLEDAPRSQ